MSSVAVATSSSGGFSFDNCYRNELLSQRGFTAPKMTKTGTTICGAIFKDGVVLGADTRATGGDLVSDKNCQKLHKMAENMWCAGAGTAADCDKTTNQMASQLELLRLNTGRQLRVCTANRMLKQMLFRYQGHIGTYLILGGVDVKGPHLYNIAAHGSSSKTPYSALGSGMLAAMSVLEFKWKPDMEEEKAKEMVGEAILSGIFNDMGSGSNVDLCVIKANDQIEYFRGYNIANVKGERKQKYSYPMGTTKVTRESVRKGPAFQIVVEEESVRHIQPMES